MLNVFERITQGKKITGSVKVFPDLQALHDFKEVEKKINRERVPEYVAKLEKEQAEITQRLNDCMMEFHLELPGLDAEEAIEAKIASKHGMAPGVEKTEEEYQKFSEELGDNLIAAAIVKVVAGDEERTKKFSVAEIKKLRTDLSEVPANWASIVEKYYEMVQTRLMDDLEFKSPDFS